MIMDWEQFASKVLSISRIGIKYSKDPYALENYEDLEKLTVEMLNSTENSDYDGNIYERDIYPTPSTSVRILVFNDKNELLMVQERDSGNWSVPGGWCDVFESSSENAQKEVRQETGLHVKIDRLLAVLQREKYKDYKTLVSEYVHYYSGIVISGELATNHETTDVGFFPLDALPPLSRKSTFSEIMKAVKVYKRESDVVFD